MIDVEPALARLLQLLLRAEIGPGGVVELQIAAAGVVERAHRLVIGGGEIVEDRVAARIGSLAHGARLEPEMHHASATGWSSSASPCVCALRNLKCSIIGCCGKSDLAGDANGSAAWSARPGTGCRGRARQSSTPSSIVEEIEMPPGAAKLAVGRKLEADLLLLADDLFDLAVLDRLELRRRDRALFALGCALPSAARCAGSCRHGRRETAVSVVGP